MISDLTPVTIRAAMIPEQSAASAGKPNGPDADCSLNSSARGGVNLRTAQPDLPSDDPVLTRGIKPHFHRTPSLQLRILSEPPVKELEIVTTAKEIIIKDILALHGVRFGVKGQMLGGELKDAAAHARWLRTLTIDSLQARRRQLQTESQREFKLQ